MIPIEQAWSRVSQRPEYRDKKLSDFMYQGITYSTTLTSLLAAPAASVVFPNGAIIVGAVGGATIQGQAATQTNRLGLDLYSLAISDGSNNRVIVGSAQAMATTVYGHYGDQFPAREIVLGANTSLQYTFTNLTTTTILVYVTHHCLVPAAVG